MEILSLDGLRVDGIALCVPANAVANEEKVAQATGIVARRIAAKGTTVADLCVQAAEKVFADTGSKPDEFGAVLCVSFTQHNRMPATAVEAQARLGLPKSVIAFDVSLACSGWGYGLYLAGLLARQTGKKVLLLDGDVQSAFVGEGDAATAPLLGDAGTATVIGADFNTEAQRHREAWKFAFVADGEKGGALKLEEGGTIQMDGFGVFKFVATDVVGYLKEFFTAEHSNIPTFEHSNIQTMTFVPHQPNVYMVRQLAKSLGIAEAQTAISCDALGNLSSASVPATIAACGVRGLVLFAGFGGGLSVSVGTIEIGADCKLAMVEF